MYVCVCGMYVVRVSVWCVWCGLVCVCVVGCGMVGMCVCVCVMWCMCVCGVVCVCLVRWRVCAIRPHPSSPPSHTPVYLAGDCRIVLLDSSDPQPHAPRRRLGPQIGTSPRTGRESVLPPRQGWNRYFVQAGRESVLPHLKRRLGMNCQNCALLNISSAFI
jgi:hypothetical protein